MSMPVRIEGELYEQAKAASKGECRTIAGQLEFWAKVGKAALDNPDLPIEFVRELLVAKAEDRKQLTDFVPGQFRG
ncbi:MAG: ParD-like family protein [Nitrosomonadales bacterium]|nr:ParD-like family protein [Nitrosomonadales bacterium]